MELNEYLKIMVAQEASDLFITAGAPPSLKIQGSIRAFKTEPLSPKASKKLAYSILSEEQTAVFEESMEMNLAVPDVHHIGRFRANIFQQRGSVSMVIRHIQTNIQSPGALGLPVVLKDLIMKKRGLILVVGATSCGKSTSLASLIDYRNRREAGHIITIEDPIEYIYENQQSIINQREIGIDTLNYEEALKNTLRQSPDVIVIGEVRTQATMEHAMTFAETGHLCVSTLHANNANQAIERIISFFPQNKHEQVLLDLSLNLVGIVSQRLIPSLEGNRVLAAEVLIATPTIKDLIKRGDIHKIKDLMEKSKHTGMMTFDESLYDLYHAEKISDDEALSNADSKNNLRLKISLKEGTYAGGADKLTLKEEPSDTGIFKG